MHSFKFYTFHIICLQIVGLVLNFHFVTSLKNKDKPCSEVGVCRCVFPTGRGVDLTPIKKDIRALDLDNNIFELNLCENIPTGNGSVDQCSICLHNVNSTTSVSLGLVEEMKVISSSQWDSEPISLQFDHNNTKTMINLLCNEEATKPKLTFKSFDGSTYYLDLESEHACLKLMAAAEGMSWGSLLVLWFLTLTLLYFGGGMLTLKYLRGAEGREMIPNIDFWMDLPNLVRDGFLFTLNGFRLPPAYDRI